MFLLKFMIDNFAPFTGLLFLLVFLVTNNQMEQKICRIFYVLLGMELVELVCYNVELWTAGFAETTPLRIFLSAVGYTIRPVLVLAFFRISAREQVSEKQFRLFAIPACINAVAAFSAFFTGIVYSYNESNEFVRGPLGYTAHIVLIFYLVCMLIFSVDRKEKSIRFENITIWTICGVIILAIALETFLGARDLGRVTIVLSTIAYYLYFQTRSYNDRLKQYMENTIDNQKEHLREMNVIGVLANEYVTVCYVDVKNDAVTPYRMAPVIDEEYGDVLRSGVSFEKVFRAYVTKEVYEEDQGFFLSLANLQQMINYLHENGTLSKKYRVLRNGTIVYCEMRVEMVKGEDGSEDLVFGFSNNDMRVRREMVYQSTVQEEMEKIEETKNSLAGIADLARQLQEAIEDKLSSL